MLVAVTWKRQPVNFPPGRRIWQSGFASKPVAFQGKPNPPPISGVCKPCCPAARPFESRRPLASSAAHRLRNPDRGQLTGFALDFRRGERIARVLRPRRSRCMSRSPSASKKRIGDLRSKREWIPAARGSAQSASMACDAVTPWKDRQATFMRRGRSSLIRCLRATVPDLAESLALVGDSTSRDALLMKLESVPPGRFEVIGDHLAATHPELARWFYENNL